MKISSILLRLYNSSSIKIFSRYKEFKEKKLTLKGRSRAIRYINSMEIFLGKSKISIIEYFNLWASSIIISRNLII